MNTDIQLYDRMQDPLNAIDRMGEMFAKSGMFGCERVEQGKVLAMICMAEKKSPVDITRDYDIVEGKLRKKALAALADFRTKHGGKHRWLASGDDVTASGDPQAKIELTDKHGEKVTYAYSLADAKQEGLVREKSRWVKRPGNMLRARCISNGLGMLCPELYAGEEEQSEPTEAPSIQMLPPAPPEPLKTATTAAPMPVVNAEIVEEKEEKALAQMGLAPLPTPAAPLVPSAPVSAPFAAGPPYTAPTAARLPDDLIAQVEQTIGEHAIAAVEWMIAQGWLAKGQGLECLTEARARRIVKQRESFLKAVGGAA